MRRAAKLIGTAGAVLAVGAGAAWAGGLAIDCDGGRCVGTNEGDAIEGTGERDQIFGRDGGDIVSALKADDLAKGGPGGDSVAGGAGDDTLKGNDGGDAIRGGNGDDRLFGDGGGSGDGGGVAAAGAPSETGDSIKDNAGGDVDRIYLGTGDDSFDVRDGDDDDYIDCGPGGAQGELDPGDFQGPGCQIE